jgi:plastocyanin
MTRRAALRAAPAFMAALGTRALAEPQVHVIVIAGMKFGTTDDPIHVGDTVSFENHDMFRHTATARDGTFDIDLTAGKEERVTLEKAGTIDIYCRFHPGMTAKLVVVP